MSSLRCLPVLLFAYALPVLFSLDAFARLARTEEVPWVIEFDRLNYDVKADGTFTLVREYQVRINNEQGRLDQSVQVQSFNSRSTRVRLLAARTINGDQKHEISPRDIEIKAIGETPQSFDEEKRMFVSYPDVRVGSRIYMKLELRRLEPPIKGHFSEVNDYSWQTTNEVSYSIRSDKEVNFAFHNADGIFVAKKSREGQRYRLNIRNSQPLRRWIVQEDSPTLDPDRTLLMMFSTDRDWKTYGGLLPGQVEKLLAEPLPPELQKIRDRVDRSATLVDQLNQVTAMIADDFRYFGDWRRRNGTHLPRRLSQIARSRYGDCKDLSLIAVAILRSLGLRAHQAWIYRGDGRLARAAYQLPSDWLFNHAIVRVRDGEKSYWIDPTNSVSFAQGIFTDIADRPAFVLDPSALGLEMTPSLEPSGQGYGIDMKVGFSPDGSAIMNGTVETVGRMAIWLTTRNFFASPDMVDYELIRWVAGDEEPSDIKVGEYDRKSRIVRDRRLPIGYRLESSGLTTTAGFGFLMLRSRLIISLLTSVKDRVSDIWLAFPQIITERYELAGVRQIGKRDIGCDLKSPWADLRRQIEPLRDGVRVSDHYVVKKAFIRSDELTSPEFTEFQKRVRACFQRTALILEHR